MESVIGVTARARVLREENRRTYCEARALKDLPQWKRKILKAARRGKNTCDNRTIFSSKGFFEPGYQEALQALLGIHYKVFMGTSSSDGMGVDYFWTGISWAGV